MEIVAHTVQIICYCHWYFGNATNCNRRSIGTHDLQNLYMHMYVTVCVILSIERRRKMQMKHNDRNCVMRASAPAFICAFLSRMKWYLCSFKFTFSSFYNYQLEANGERGMKMSMHIHRESLMYSCVNVRKLIWLTHISKRKINRSSVVPVTRIGNKREKKLESFV